MLPVPTADAPERPGLSLALLVLCPTLDDRMCQSRRLAEPFRFVRSQTSRGKCRMPPDKLTQLPRGPDREMALEYGTLDGFIRTFQQ